MCFNSAFKYLHYHISYNPHVLALHTGFNGVVDRLEFANLDVVSITNHVVGPGFILDTRDVFDDRSHDDLGMACPCAQQDAKSNCREGDFHDTC